MNSNLRTTSLSILTFIIIEILLVLFLVFIKQKEVEITKKRELVRVNDLYEGLIGSYRDFSTGIFNSLINQPEVLQLIKNYDTTNDLEKEKVREEIYHKLKFVYEVIKLKNFGILHFHTKDGKSLLRFHKKNKFGDDLKPFRQSIKDVTINNQYSEGFEEGRIINSYRFIYPLIIDGEYVGSVETSVSMYDLLQEMEHSVDGQISFIINEETVNRVLKESNKNYYSKSNYTGYYNYLSPLTDSAFHIKSDTFSRKTLHDLSYQSRGYFSKNENTHKAVNEIYYSDTLEYIISFIPIQNINKQFIAYAVIYNSFGQLKDLKREFWIFTIIGSFINLLITIIIIPLILGRQKAILQKNHILEAKERAEEITKLKSSFLANMSHEIRTPMNGIIGMTDIIKRSSLTTDQREYLDIIDTSANNLMTILNDILDFSKIESDKIILENIPFSLGKIIDQVVDTVFLKAEENNIDFITFIDPEIPNLLLGDPQRLRQVIINFVNNALKFAKDGEVILLSEVIEKSKNKIKVEIRIKDTGIGISKEKQNEIFESFSQADESVARKFGGTGLGLAISKRLVELMGGNIKLDSKLGVGSTFSCFIDFDISDKGVDAKFNLEKIDLSHLKVLIIDDNEANQNVFNKYLTYWNIACEEAYNVDEAIMKIKESMASKHIYDIIFVDYHMPNKTGFDFADEMNELNFDIKPKLILLSSISDMFSSNEIYEKGFSSYIYKPVKIDQFQETVLSLLDIQLSNGGNEMDEDEFIRETKNVNYNILLVEDNIINQKVASITLQNMGHKTDIANNGKEGYEMFLKHDYDIILMDIQMPVMNGVESSKMIRDYEAENKTIRPIKIVALTANALKEEVNSYLEAGMDGVITKPFKPIDVSSLFNKFHT